MQLRLFVQSKSVQLKACMLFSILGASDMSHAAETNQEQKLKELLSLSFSELMSLPITSTSYFTERPLDVASTVTVIAREDWEKRGARRLSDAFVHLPGVVSLPNFLGSYATIIRGYAQSDARGVVTLWDGVSINSFNLSTADVDRPNVQLPTLNSIEVIRGPGSVYHGTDAFHGVVSLNAFESDKDINRVDARLGSNGFYSSSLNSSVAIGGGWRLNASIASSGQPDQNSVYTYTDTGTNLPATNERDYKYLSNTAVLKFISDQSKRLSFRIGIYYDETDRDNFHGNGGQGGDPQNDVASVDSDLAMLQVRIKYKLNDTQNLELQTYRWDQFHFFERPVNALNNIAINADENREAAKLIYRNEKLTNNTQFSAALAVRQDHIEVAHRRVFNNTTTVVDADLPFSGQKRRIKSLELNAKTSLQDSPWIFHYGFRLDNYDSFGDQITPRAAVIYKLDQESVFKILYGNAFRAPNAIELAGSPFIAGDPNIQPEEINTYELVYLRQGKTSRFEAVLFVNEWKNAISSIDTDNDAVNDTFANVTDNKAYGLEVSYQEKLRDWVIETSGSYIRSKSEEAGTGFDAFPRYIFNIGVGYAPAQGWQVYLSNRIYLQVNDGPERAAILPKGIKDYWRTDLHISKNYNKRWKAYVNFRNLFDRENFLPSLVNTENAVEDDEYSVDAGVTYTF